MASILLTRGFTALVDDCHLAGVLLVASSWRVLTGGKRRTSYAVANTSRSERRETVYLHRVVWALAGRASVPRLDHKDGDGLNCTLDNLRICTQSQNSANVPVRLNNQLGIKGVCARPGGRFQAQIQVAGQNTYLGMHDTAEMAKAAYDEAAVVAFGAFARP